jgi:excinuclease ABC subunit C
MDSLKDTLSKLPDSPGVYRFYNQEHTIIYVGKAKSLKKRVTSYFNKQSQYNRKTEKLVSEIQSIEFTLAETEFDALLLENNFIKQYQPKYNILLKDDKSFPFLAILKERFPRIISTRKFIPDSGEYFGPYTSVVSMNNVLDLIRQLYTIRTCTFDLSPENIEKRKFKVCLEFHLGNCLGPCEGRQDEEAYNKEIAQARMILKGNLKAVLEFFTTEMKKAAEGLQFEKAEDLKRKLSLVDRFQTSSMVVNKKLTDIDVITIVSSASRAASPDDATVSAPEPTSGHFYLNFMMVNEGAIIFSQNIQIQRKLDETEADVLTSVYYTLRSNYNSKNPIVFSNLPLTIKLDNPKNILPQIGDKRKLIALSLKNALSLKVLKETESTKDTPNIALVKLKEDLRLSALPYHIECFDNSNLQGTTPVASMVKFTDGKPNKKEYRHFNIKTVEGPNDFASMEEIVGRRYSRLVSENKPLPDLIIVDGGKGQLSSATDALKKLNLYGRVPIVGIAKNLEEIYFPEDSIPLHISKKSLSLKLMQRIRDEAHRFAITFHRLKRSKKTFNSELDIKGLGHATQQKLLKHFKSVSKIKSATEVELTEVIGKSKTKILLDQLQTVQS